MKRETSVIILLHLLSSLPFTLTPRHLEWDRSDQRMQALDTPTVTPAANHDALSESQPPSPTAPPYSPITPTMSSSLPFTNVHPAAAHQPYPYTPQNEPVSRTETVPARHEEHPSTKPVPPNQPQAQQPPPPQPILMSDNPDAIALRAAMSVLQIQRQQALKDMKTLETQKEKALEAPETFAQDVRDGKIKMRGMEGIIPTQGIPSVPDENSQMDGSDEMKGISEETGTKSDPFGDIPSAQNVVRMPPVNWAKYHVVGESLDKLHDEQRARPSPGYPSREEDTRPRERAPESVVAAPYNPWEDKVQEKPARAKTGAKKKG